MPKNTPEIAFFGFLKKKKKKKLFIDVQILWV